MRRLIICFVLPALSQAHPSVNILMDSKGNVYYSDLKQVWKITPAGTKTIAVPNVHSHELFIDSNDNLAWKHLWSDGDASNSWVILRRLNATGQFEKLIPQHGDFYQLPVLIGTNSDACTGQGTRTMSKIMRRNADGISHHGQSLHEENQVDDGFTGRHRLFRDDRDLKKMDVNGQISLISPNIPELSLSSNRDDHYIGGLSLDH